MITTEALAEADITQLISRAAQDLLVLVQAAALVRVHAPAAEELDARRRICILGEPQ